MEWNWIELAPYAAPVGVIVGTVLTALISRWKSPLDSVAIKADAIRELTGSISEINTVLASERRERIDDCIKFELDIANLRDELVTRYENRLATEIEQLRVYYEDKIKRLEQAHRDRVAVLKERILKLENGLNNDC
jgi:iron-sulfur cluster repair protein YtfE (RIC family)